MIAYQRFKTIEKIQFSSVESDRSCLGEWLGCFDCSDLTEINLVLWKFGPLSEVVAHGGWTVC